MLMSRSHVITVIASGCSVGDWRCHFGSLYSEPPSKVLLLMPPEAAAGHFLCGDGQSGDDDDAFYCYPFLLSFGKERVLH